MSTEGMPWVVIYNHRHGEDVWIEDTREQAKLSIMDTILGFAYELDEESRQEFLQAAAEGDFDKATDLYFSAMGHEEDYQIYRLNRSEPASAVGIRERAAAELAELMSASDEGICECLDPDIVLKYNVFRGEPTIYIRAKMRDVRRNGQDRVEYRVEVVQGGKIIFPYGQLFCSPGPGFTEDQTKALITELVAMAPNGGHGVDDDYFANYTDEQREWADRHGDALGLEARALEEDPE